MGNGVSARGGGNSREKETVSADAPEQMGSPGRTRRKREGATRGERAGGGEEREEDFVCNGVVEQTQ